MFPLRRKKFLAGRLQGHRFEDHTLRHLPDGKVFSWQQEARLHPEEKFPVFCLRAKRDHHPRNRADEGLILRISIGSLLRTHE